MTAMLEAALASLPEDVLARSLGFVRVEELARLSEAPSTRARRPAYGAALWFGLFAAPACAAVGAPARRARARRGAALAAHRGAHLLLVLAPRLAPSARASPPRRALPPPGRRSTRAPDTGNTALLVACGLARAACGSSSGSARPTRCGESRAGRASAGRRARDRALVFARRARAGSRPRREGARRPAVRGEPPARHGPRARDSPDRSSSAGKRRSSAQITTGPHRCGRSVWRG